MTALNTVGTAPLRHFTLLESANFEAFHYEVTTRFSSHQATPLKHSLESVDGYLASVQLISGLHLSSVSYGAEVMIEADPHHGVMINLPSRNPIEVELYIWPATIIYSIVEGTIS